MRAGHRGRRDVGSPPEKYCLRRSNGASGLRRIAKTQSNHLARATPSSSLLLRFTLRYRDVEDPLAERGLDVSYETVRRWVLKFGPLFARELRRRRPRGDNLRICRGFQHVRQGARRRDWLVELRGSETRCSYRCAREQYQYVKPLGPQIPCLVGQFSLENNTHLG